MKNTTLSLTSPLLLLLTLATELPSPAAEMPAKTKAETALPACFGELTEQPLPDNLRWATDVRWLEDQSVAISAVNVGVVRLPLAPPGQPPSTEMADGGRGSSTSAPWSVGASEKYLAVAAPMHTVGWKAAGAASMAGEDYFEFIWDLDVQGDRLLVLGMRKTDDGRAYAEEGAFVWLGSLGGPNLEAMRPLAFSADGSSARALNECGAIFVGAARFLEDGSFVAVPSTEPGIFLFGADGRLKRTWASEEFGLDGGCGLSEEQFHRIGTDLALRMEWINRRRLVDDILPLGEDRFGLLVRHQEDGTTRWRLEFAGPEGRLGACEVPLAVPNSWVNLRVDRRGERVALLQIARIKQLQPPGPVIPSRLFVSKIAKGALPDRK